MVTVGFVVEGASESVLVRSDIFRRWIMQHGNMKIVDPVVDARGNGGQCKRNIKAHVEILRNQASACRVVVLADLDPEDCAPCIRQRKEIIGSDGIDLVVIARQAIESWFLADTDAMRRWLNDPTFYEANPEMPSKTSWDRLKEISRERGQRGPGKSRLIFARKMIGSYEFDVTRAAQHPGCPSAGYFINRMRQLVT